MSKDLSLETRASSAYVQGQLQELITVHMTCFDHYQCEMLQELVEVLTEWKQAEAELQASKARCPKGEYEI